MLVPAGRLTDTPAHTDWDGGDAASPRHTSLGRERKWSPERPRQTWGGRACHGQWPRLGSEHFVS